MTAHSSISAVGQLLPAAGVARRTRTKATEQGGSRLESGRHHFQTRRYWTIHDVHLAGNVWLLETCSVLDMAVWGSARAVPVALGPDAWGHLPHTESLLGAVNQRPAAQCAALLKDRHRPKAETHDEAGRAVFVHLV